MRWALNIEERTLCQEMLVASTNQKDQGNRFFLDLCERSQACQHLDLSPVKLISNFDFKNFKRVSWCCCATKFIFCYSIIWKLKHHYLSTFVAKSSPLEVYGIHLYKSFHSRFLFTIIEDPGTYLFSISCSSILPEAHHLCSAWILSPRTSILLLSYLISVFIQNSCLIT